MVIALYASHTDTIRACGERGERRPDRHLAIGANVGGPLRHETDASVGERVAAATTAGGAARAAAATTGRR